MMLIWEVRVNEYRRTVRTSKWHWMEDCREYPEGKAFEVGREPLIGSLCERCKSLQDETIHRRSR